MSLFSFFKKGFKKSKRDIKLICFDIDNTLCDFAAVETETEAYMAELILRDIKKLQSKIKKHGKHGNVKNSCSVFTILKIFNQVKKEYLYRDLKPGTYSRMTWFKTTIERLNGNAASDNTALSISFDIMILRSSSYEKRYWEQINKKLRNYPATISTLDFLKSKGFKLATISDSDGLVGMKYHRIKLLGLDKYFDYIVTGDDIGLNKPAIENWNKLLELSGLKGKQCVMIGDHPDIDLVTAKRLGFITIWTKQSLNNDLRHDYVDFEIHDIKEIIDVVEKLI